MASRGARLPHTTHFLLSLRIPGLLSTLPPGAWGLPRCGLGVGGTARGGVWSARCLREPAKQGRPGPCESYQNRKLSVIN